MPDSLTGCAIAESCLGFEIICMFHFLVLSIILGYEQTRVKPRHLGAGSGLNNGVVCIWDSSTMDVISNEMGAKYLFSGVASVSLSLPGICLTSKQ